MQALLDAFPVRLVGAKMESGRSLVTKTDVAKGTLLLRSPAVTAAVHKKHEALVCLRCLKFSDDDERPLPTRCESCSAVYYCGEACRNADAALHGTHCAQLKKASRDKAIKREELLLVRLLFRLLAAPESTMRPVNVLMADHEAVGGFKKRDKQRKSAAKAFVALLPPKPDTDCADVGAGAAGGGAVAVLAAQLVTSPEFRSVTKLVRILSRGPLNAFAVCSVQGETAGSLWFPAGAMLNHSCMPTAANQLEGNAMCFYAVDDLKAGTEITFSYTNIEQTGVLTRRETLWVNWGFQCQCLRCRYDGEVLGHRGKDTDAQEYKLKLDAYDTAHCCKCKGISAPAEHRGPATTEGCSCNTVNLVTPEPSGE